MVEPTIDSPFEVPMRDSHMPRRSRREALTALAAIAAAPLAGCASPAPPPAAPVIMTGDLTALFHSPQPPRVGDRWRYRYVSGWRNVPPRDYTVQVLEVAPERVRDRLTIEGVGGADERSFGPRFEVVERPLAGASVREPNPYLQAFQAGILGAGPRSVVLPRPNWGMDWYAQVQTFGPEQVTVAAGTFEAMRIEIAASRSPVGLDSQQDAHRFVEVVWYAPRARRTVLHTRESFARRTWPLDRDRYELVEFVSISIGRSERGSDHGLLIV
jgi:hypothetical protein